MRCGRMAAAAGLFLAGASGAALAQSFNDYPTSTRADYVFACMKANGETQPMLERCSCSIDVIASLLPHDRYVEAETFLRMGQLTGKSGCAVPHQ